MVIIRANRSLKAEAAYSLHQVLHDQARSGVIILPMFCELLNEVPADEEIQIIQQDPRVAELEAKLEEMMKSDCDTCATKSCNARSASVVRINCPLWRHG